jgi:hypothetical protein
MGWKLTVAGVDHTDDVDAAQITRALNARAQLHFATGPGYVPARFAEVVAYDQDGVTPLFGGLITRRGGAPFGDASAAACVTAVECGDFFTYFDWAYLTLTYPTTHVTLKAALEDLVALLPAAYGITLDPAQVAGPALATFTWVRKRASDAVRELSDRTGYVAVLSPGKVLRMFVPGSVAAPFAITDGDPHCTSLAWADSDQIPANSVTCICGPSGAVERSQRWIQAGGATSWTTDIPAAAGTFTGLAVVGGLFCTVGPGAMFTWDAATSTLHLGTFALPANGTIIDLVYTAQFPFIVTATSGTTPVIEVQEEYPDVVDVAQAQEIADGRLAQLNQQPRQVDVVSIEPGWAPGQALTIARTDRLTADCLITNDTITLNTALEWVYAFTAIENDTYQGSYLDQWRAMTGGGSSGVSSVSGVGGGGTTVVLAAPVYLGGSYSTLVTNPVAKKLIQNAVPYVAPASFTGRLRVNLRARDAGVGMKAIISDGTTDVATSVVTNQAFVDEGVIVAIVAGHTYWVYIQNTVAGDGAVGYATLEAA